MNKIDSYVQFLVDVASDNAKGYSQSRRDEMNEGDCSSWLIDALRSVGFKMVGAHTTRDMYNPLLADGFTDVTSTIDLRTGKGLKKGHVCLRPFTQERGGHVIVMTDDNLHIFQAAGDFDYARGDSSAKELLIRDYYDSPYKYVLAPPVEEPVIDVCPYPEPNTLFKNGITFRGDDARWFQWHLNRAGYSLTLDGIAGSKTWSAINKAQEKGAIGAGNAGSLTRAIIRKM